MIQYLDLIDGKWQNAATIPVDGYVNEEGDFIFAHWAEEYLLMGMFIWGNAEWSDALGASVIRGRENWREV